VTRRRGREETSQGAWWWWWCGGDNAGLGEAVVVVNALCKTKATPTNSLQ
jgi:hypothetical protein